MARSPLLGRLHTHYHLETLVPHLHLLCTMYMLCLHVRIAYERMHPCTCHASVEGLTFDTWHQQVLLLLVLLLSPPLPCWRLL